MAFAKKTLYYRFDTKEARVGLVNWGMTNAILSELFSSSILSYQPYSSAPQ
jgi:hypothetical protein